MLKKIDEILNKITMYRLVLYYLTFLWVVGFFLSVFGILAFSPFWMVVSLLVILSISFGVNTLFARVYKAQTNVESLYITAYILALIISPLPGNDWQSFLFFIGWASVWAMASKFIFAIGKKHLFNPAAFAVALMSLTFGQSATWWVGSAAMLLPVFAGGMLIVRKIRRTDLVFSFVYAAIATVFVFSVFLGTDPVSALMKALVNSPLFFFAFVMLTEPLTTPPTRNLQIAYGALTGILFAPQMHLGSLYFTPETSLLVGNVFSYLVSPKEKLLLTLVGKKQIARDTFDFVFQSDKALRFQPGQYLEWTLGHDRPDDRGNRRYFTISSSPTEKEISMGVKFYEKPSTFKKNLQEMQQGDAIIATQLAGDFVLPDDKNAKLAFIAGGIGITPFISMLKYLLDKQERRDIVVFYANACEEDIAYKEIFERAEKELGIKTIFALTDEEKVASSWQGHRGRIDAALVKERVADWDQRIYYISGPHAMVAAYQQLLKDMALPSKQIKTDFFPGFA